MTELHSLLNENNIDNDDELSTTLLERRKRLHDLATEINKWEDESSKNPHAPSTQNLTTPNSTSNLNLTYTNRTPPPPPNTLQYNSPKQIFNYQIMSFSNKSPSIQSYVSPLASNKENKTPIPPGTNKTVSSSGNSKTQLVTPSSSEILNVAQRILSKRQSNSAITTSNSASSTSGQDQQISLSVKSIKSKFENIGKENSDSGGSVVNTVPMTPRSIIKKFEEMLKDGSQNNPLNGSIAPAGSISASNSVSSLKGASTKASTSKTANNNITPACIPKPIKPAGAQDSTDLGSDHITPKSIIKKFEQLSKAEATAAAAISQPVEQPAAKKAKESNASATGSYCATLTYVSSMVVSSEDNLNKLKDFDDEEAIYEELSSSLTAKNEQETSLFSDASETSESESEEEENTQTESTATNTYSMQETYSISGSSYTGSFVNEDEFNDIDSQDDPDYIYDDDINSKYEDDEDATFSQTNMEEESVYEKADCGKPPIASAQAPVQASQVSELNDLVGAEPLFSIQEYRKQKRRHNGRRSSVMPARQSISNSKKHATEASKALDKKPATVNTPPMLDDNQKKAKYLERIKELEELIKQEDNVIHQTGIALERCLTDTHFTGSSEHIECNRILLISCQKRQAFVTEINRQKQLISSLNSNKKQNASSSHLNSDESDQNELSQADLTGLLIFSDLQLPVKESYINKLKAGDEKRIYYFLCLIRNGIQVLQTQVISVQELISTRDTSIVFPNRMAISNVDINFKVKIDIYGMEILPKDTKTTKQTLASNATSKFFSPFKTNLFHSSSSSSHNNHHSHHNTSSNNSNHHYNEQNNLGVLNGGAKTSNFIHIDTIEITNRDIYNNKFKISISSSSIPLTGLLYVNVRCMPSKSIELKGFMTLFEDVNGFGSWDRRWCFLNNYNISYWKYPEDEYRNGPLGIINLTKCVNDKISVLPRDLCARKYTIELVCETESNSAELDTAMSKDQNCKLVNDKNKYKRYRLSADTKDQVNDWITNINYALANLRLWNPKAIKPIRK